MNRQDLLRTVSAGASAGGASDGERGPIPSDGLRPPSECLCSLVVLLLMRSAGVCVR
jgi:hypothetical protein